MGSTAYSCLLALLLVVVIDALDINDAEKLFYEFKVKFSKNYSNDEEATRFSYLLIIYVSLMIATKPN